MWNCKEVTGGPVKGQRPARDKERGRQRQMVQTVLEIWGFYMMAVGATVLLINSLKK